MRRLASRAARRYMVGWYRTGEVHTLSAPGAARALRRPRLRARAAAQPAPRLHGAGVGTNNPLLPPPAAPRPAVAAAARRVARRGRRAALLRAGAVPARGDRDAPARRPGAVPAGRARRGLLGGALFDLLQRERGERACVRLATHPAADPRAALEDAFGGSARRDRRRLARASRAPRDARAGRLAGALARRSSGRRPATYDEAWNVSPDASSSCAAAPSPARPRSARWPSRGRPTGRPRPDLPEPGPARPLKGLALGGFGPLRSAHDPHDYLEWGNREYVRASRTDVIRMQVSWRFLQPQAPAQPRRVVAAAGPRARQRRAAPPRPPDRGGQPGRRARDPRPLPLLSGVVQRNDARHVGAGHRQAVRRQAAARPVARRARGRGSSSYLCDRYGGPSRPHIWGLEICNEPNLLCWPQAGRRRRGRRDGDHGGARGGGPPVSRAAAASRRPRTFPTRTWSSRASRSPPAGPASPPRCSTACAGSTRAAPRCRRGRITTIATRRPPTGAATARGR